MNSLNIISSRVSPSSSPAPTRSNSLNHLGLAASSANEEQSRGNVDNEKGGLVTEPEDLDSENKDENDGSTTNEKTPLLSKSDVRSSNIRSSSWHTIPSRVANAFINSLRWVFSTVTAPGLYLIAYFYDEHGNFAPLRQLRRLFGVYAGDTHKLAADTHESTIKQEISDLERRGSSAKNKQRGSTASRPAVSSASSSSGLSSESESDPEPKQENSGRRSSRQHARSKSLEPTEEIAPSRKSIRIKLHNDEALRQRKHKKARSTSATGESGSSDISAHLKSPTSPVAALTKYPKTPAPPRPLIPRRQPSYLPYDTPPDPEHMKTLILDLDETLIHSMSKGGRVGSGHMVEVRLNTTYVGASGQQALGPQHPILYYVHKRPHCDDFLRRICKWFNLVIFTASVQEYADPVIDWLDPEKKLFSARYYRQHCTFRHGAFIKDLSSVEPDLSKVMILDNSPLSYMFHQDNAIPIQGWINDPTDNDLLHLIPLLEGLQYVSDVRALLALRGGEDGQHMVT